MSCIQISLEAHIWQAIWTDSAFLANIVCSFTKEHIMYIDLLIIINFNIQKCRYVSCGKHKRHVSTNWIDITSQCLWPVITHAEDCATPVTYNTATNIIKLGREI